MKKILLPLLGLCLCGFLNAQDKQVEMLLENNAKLQKVLDLKENGLVIKTGKDKMNTKALEWVIRYYSASAELIWEKPIKKTQINKGFGNPILAAPSGSYVYQIEKKGYNTTFGVTKFLLTQIAKDGTVKTKELEKVKTYGYRQMTFCDDNNLYFLSTKNGDETHKKKKLEEKMLLNRVSHKGFAFKQLTIDLPVVEDPKNSNFWTYAGHDNDAICLMYKIVNIETGQYTYHVALVNSDGKVTKKFKINADLISKHLRPSYNVKQFSASYQNRDRDFYSHYNQSTNSTTMKHTLSAFGNAVVDMKNKAIYIYGLSGPKPFKNLGPINDGYFISKFDMEGNSVWKIQNDVSKQLRAESFFRIHSSPYYRNLALNINPDQTLKFQIWFKKQVHSYEIATDGTVVNGYYHKFGHRVSYGDASMCYTPTKKVKSKEYIKTLNMKAEKRTYYRYFSNSKSEVLLLDKPKEDKIELLYFDF